MSFDEGFFRISDTDVYRSYRIKSSSFYLYDPSQKRRYHVKISKILAGAILYASKFGWLLLSKRTKFWHNSYPFFFYCPFTGEIIQLPELELNCGFNQATFSTAPTSSGCVICVFHMCWHHEEIDVVPNKYGVTTCSPGDTTWSNLRLNDRFRGLITSVAYSKGVFYCVFQYRFLELPHIATYNLALQEWKIYRCPPFIQRFNLRPHPEVELIDSPDDDGKILVSYCYGECYVCVFSSVINNISLPAAEGEASELANTIQWVGYRRYISTSSGGKGQSCPQIYDWVGPPTSRWNIVWAVWPGSDTRVWIQPRHACPQFYDWVDGPTVKVL
ncbi:hypothetical protein LWI28_011015 [Acer negundo]|uniref:KIB1-4 beta-propeller domain-containing protein n=1 Tax=Acer negundo TaxID=4023 RepID=A0AAD5J456_ACENE|nr:hypothetical protein LWI28_011015 [Acer negundo]